MWNLDLWAEKVIGKWWLTVVAGTTIKLSLAKKHGHDKGLNVLAKHRAGEKSSRSQKRPNA
jgi:hypothetical protein